MIISPYRRGADDGFSFGLYMSVLFMSIVLGSQFPAGGLLSLVLMAGVPVVVFRRMVRFERDLAEHASLSFMWMHGVVTFICALLIASACLAVYLIWVEPGFILGQMQRIVDMGAQMPGTKVAEMGELFRLAIEERMVPTPMDLVKELFLTGVFTGSLLSLSISTVRSAARRRRGLNNSTEKTIN